MDHPVNVLSLCTGYGGVELGLERLGLSVRPVAYVEREGFAIANLVAKMETGQLAPAPVYTDVKTFPYSHFRGCVDLLTAGYPCQPFSAAGNRKGKEDPRHLWPWIADGIAACRPAWCFFENVEGHISLGLRDVLSDLVELGYRPTWGLFSAAEVGAPHQRKRVFILAHGNGQRQQGDEWKGPPEAQKQPGGHVVQCSGSLADSNHSRGQQDCISGKLRAEGSVKPPSNRWPSRPGEAQKKWEEPRTVADRKCERLERQRDNKTEQYRKNEGIQSWTKNGGDKHTGKTQPELGGAVDGLDRGVDPIANRVDRLRMIGNGVCPQTAAKAFATLYRELTT